MEKNINWQMRSHYESFLKTLKKEEQETSLLFHLCDTLPNIISWLASYAKTEEEKKFVDECGEQAIKLYQRSLDYNYEKIRQYKESKNESDKSFEYLVMTVDESGNPKRTKVIGIDHGNPIFEDNCILNNVYRKMVIIDSNVKKLSRWLKKEETLKKMLDEALKLKNQGSLGSSEIPSPNYNTYGMSREQSDAQAWENYTIENGMYRITNYDITLDELIENLKQCIDFYDKIISIV